MNIGKFRKKPVEIEAVQLPRFPGDQVIMDSEKNTIGQFIDLCTEIADWCGGISHMMLDEDDFASEVEGTEPGPCILIKTLEGQMQARPGDWIIKGVKGEFYPCKPDIFEATYEDATLVPFEAVSEAE